MTCWVMIHLAVLTNIPFSAAKPDMAEGVEGGTLVMRCTTLEERIRPRQDKPKRPLKHGPLSQHSLKNGHICSCFAPVSHLGLLLSLLEAGNGSA